MSRPDIDRRTILIRAADMFDGEQMLGRRDVLLREGRIEQIAEAGGIEAPQDALTVDGEGMLLSPGFIDMHCHLRDPGYTWKEDIVSGTRAAAAGGYTTVVCMPNTDPPIDRASTAEYIIDKAQRVGFARVSPAGALSRRRKGRELADLAAMYAAGVRIFTDDGDDTQGPDVFLSTLEWLSMLPGARALIHTEVQELARGAMHEGDVSALLGHPGIHRLSEDLGTARAVLWALEAGQPVQITHMASRGAAELAAFGKLRARHAGSEGLVSCDVTYNHLLLTEQAIAEHGADAKINPPLRTDADRRALHNALAAGWLDCLVTDHAPHTLDEKMLELERAPFGFTGFEISFGLLNAHTVGSETKFGAITREQVLALLTSRPGWLMHGAQGPCPAQALFNGTGQGTASWQLGEADDAPDNAPKVGLEALRDFTPRAVSLSTGRIAEGMPADVTLLDTESAWQVEPEKFKSKGRNTPFTGWQAKGRALLTICDGQVTHSLIDGIDEAPLGGVYG